MSFTLDSQFLLICIKSGTSSTSSLHHYTFHSLRLVFHFLQFRPKIARFFAALILTTYVSEHLCSPFHIPLTKRGFSKIFLLSRLIQFTPELGETITETEARKVSDFYTNFHSARTPIGYRRASSLLFSYQVNDESESEPVVQMNVASVSKLDPLSLANAACCMPFPTWCTG